MPLTSAQRNALRAKADEAGVDADELIAEAESLSVDDASKSNEPKDTPSKSEGDAPKLFMYLLPFVRVREVRKIWLGLDEAFPGDNEVASAWAAKQGGGGSTEPEQ